MDEKHEYSVRNLEFSQEVPSTEAVLWGAHLDNKKDEDKSQERLESVQTWDEGH